MAKEWIGIIGSRFVDVYEDLEDELDVIIRSIKSRGRGIILSAAPGIDCRTLAYLLKYHADDVNFEVHMEQESIHDFEAECMALVDKELLDAQEAQYTIDQIKRLNLEMPDALKKGQKSEEAEICGRYSSVVANCDEVFAIHANRNGSPVVEETIKYANENDMPVTVKQLRRTAA